MGGYEDFKDIEKVETRVGDLVSKYGRFPTYTEVSKSAHGRALISAMWRHHGGFGKIREKMGYKPIFHSTEYLKKWENIRDDIESLAKIIGRFPTSADMRKHGKSWLSSAIQRYHGGFHEAREKMGYGQLKRPPGYLKNKENIKHEFDKLIKKYGHFPTVKEINESNQSSIIAAASTQYGSLRKLREHMGYKSESYPNGYLKDIENVKKEIEKYIKKYGTFPTSGKLDLVNSGLGSAIQKYHGGMRRLRDEMGYNQIRVSDGFWKDWKNVETALTKIIKREGKLPPNLNKVECSSGMIVAISKYHGGMRKVRKKLGYENETKPPNYWKSWDNFKKKMEPTISKFYLANQRLPKARELVNLGKNSLVLAAVRYYGGLNKVYSKLGYLPVNSVESFISLVENDEALKSITKIIGNDPVTLADIIAVKYADRYKRKDLVKFFNDRPALREYMGKFAIGIGDWDDFEILASKTLPFDKGNKIKSIIIKKGIEYALKNIGHKPSDKEIKAKIKELERRLYRI